MSLFRRYSTAFFENYIREHASQSGKIDRKFLSAVIILAVLAAAFFTIYELRHPPISVDSDQMVFAQRAEQLLEGEKPSLWLSGKTAKQLMQQGSWATLDDYRNSTTEDAFKKLLGRSAAVYDWEALVLREIDALWQQWSATEPRPDPEAFLTEAVARLKTEQTLPGLSSNQWLAITPYNERYLLIFAEDQWAICPVEDLKDLT